MADSTLQRRGTWPAGADAAQDKVAPASAAPGVGGQASAPPPGKARLRGAIHHYAVFVALAVGIMLIFEAQCKRATIGCIVYTFSTTNLFGTSALYHRPNWQPSMRQFMRRLDHAAIFGLIAGTNTPLALLALEPAQATWLLSLVWGGALLGAAQCLFFSHAPKALAATLYVALGWAVLPYVEQYKAVLAGADVALIVAGGVIYSLGALVYALKRPDPVPHVYGYHEVFHTLVTLAALLHFIAVYRVVNSPLGAGGP